MEKIHLKFGGIRYSIPARPPNVYWAVLFNAVLLLVIIWIILSVLFISRMIGHYSGMPVLLCGALIALGIMILSTRTKEDHPGLHIAVDILEIVAAMATMWFLYSVQGWDWWWVVIAASPMIVYWASIAVAKKID